MLEEYGFVPSPSSVRTIRVLHGREFRWSAQSGPMAKDFHVDKLADEFGQYVLHLKCESCLHERRTTPMRCMSGRDLNQVGANRHLGCKSTAESWPR
jgi:hypothetical protein